MQTSKQCGIVSKCNSLQDAFDAIRLYKSFMEDKSYLIEVDEDEALKMMSTKIRSGSHFFLYRVNGRIRGWILATKIRLPYFTGHSLYIEYYCSDLLGFQSISCMRALHEEIVKSARICKVERVVATCGWFDTNRKYARALQMLGWRIDNALCVNVL